MGKPRAPFHDDAPPTFDDFQDSCRGRVRFPSMGHARGRLRVITQQAQDGDRPWMITTFKCRNCKRWHLGTRALAARLTARFLTVHHEN